MTTTKTVHLQTGTTSARCCSLYPLPAFEGCYSRDTADVTCETCLALARADKTLAQPWHVAEPARPGRMTDERMTLYRRRLHDLERELNLSNARELLAETERARASEADLADALELEEACRELAEARAHWVAEVCEQQAFFRDANILQATEVRRLREALAAAEAAAQRWQAEAESRREIIFAAEARAEALWKYAQHHTTCGAYRDGKWVCDCGLDNLRGGR